MKKCILALDIGGTSLKCGLFDGPMLISGSLDSQPVNSSGSFEEIHQAYFSLLSRVRDFAMVNGLVITGVSVDTPGPFDYNNGVCLMTHKYQAIKDKSLIPIIRAPLGNLPVRFMHDSAAFIQGAAAGLDEYNRFAGVMIGTGLGFALMINGEVLKNKSGEPLYSIYSLPCGSGIAEDAISGRGIVNAYNARAKSPAKNAKEVGLRAEAGDVLAISVHRDMAASLAELISPILDEYRIEALLLGGQVSKSFNLFGATLKEKLAGVKSLVYIAPARNIDLAHLIGAAVGK
ncbi:MAG: ROK family protein [Clostridiales bacterium]|nr:ROK family protein [Clostridiales bacterium]